MHVGCDYNDDDLQPLGENIFPKSKLYPRLSEEEQRIFNAALAQAEEENIHLDIRVVQVLFKVMREIKDSNKLRGDQSGNII